MMPLRFLLRFLDLFAPAIAARLVVHQMSHPGKRKLRPFEVEILARSENQEFIYKEARVHAYKWGKGNAGVAMLIHGWEGHAGNFGGLVDILLDKGYRVIAFDGPSHGRSSKRRTSMFDYAEFISEMFSIHRPDIVVSHSFGTVAGIFALSDHDDIAVKTWLVITTPFDFRDRINDIREMLGVTTRTVSHLIRLIEKETGRKIDALNMEVMGASTEIGEVVIIHSVDDKVIPIQDARDTARVLKNTKLIELRNVGHYAILWSHETKRILRNLLDEKNEEL